MTTLTSNIVEITPFGSFIFKKNTRKLCQGQIYVVLS